MHDRLSDTIDEVIFNAIKNLNNLEKINSNSFEDLISMGELIDRLSIVNFKLYKLKDDVMLNLNDTKFKSWAAEEDIKLVLERARLKKCIDHKLISIINKIYSGDLSGGFNAEVKKYGDVK